MTFASKLSRQLRSLVWTAAFVVAVFYLTKHISTPGTDTQLHTNFNLTLVNLPPLVLSDTHPPGSSGSKAPVAAGSRESVIRYLQEPLDTDQVAAGGNTSRATVEVRLHLGTADCVKTY